MPKKRTRTTSSQPPKRVKLIPPKQPPAALEPVRSGHGSDSDDDMEDEVNAAVAQLGDLFEAPVVAPTDEPVWQLRALGFEQAAQEWEAKWEEVCMQKEPDIKWVEEHRWRFHAKPDESPPGAAGTTEAAELRRRDERKPWGPGDRFFFKELETSRLYEGVVNGPVKDKPSFYSVSLCETKDVWMLACDDLLHPCDLPGVPVPFGPELPSARSPGVAGDDEVRVLQDDDDDEQVLDQGGEQPLALMAPALSRVAEDPQPSSPVAPLDDDAGVSEDPYGSFGWVRGRLASTIEMCADAANVCKELFDGVKNKEVTLDRDNAEEIEIARAAAHACSLAASRLRRLNKPPDAPVAERSASAVEDGDDAVQLDTNPSTALEDPLAKTQALHAECERDLKLTTIGRRCPHWVSHLRPLDHDDPLLAPYAHAETDLVKVAHYVKNTFAHSTPDEMDDLALLLYHSTVTDTVNYKANIASLLRWHAMEGNERNAKAFLFQQAFGFKADTSIESKLEASVNFCERAHELFKMAAEKLPPSAVA